jgi:hypothetical protein
MLDTKARERAETLFERNEKREGEISDALKQEAARYEATVANMHRLKALRLSRSASEIRIKPSNTAGYKTSLGRASLR